jgi:hypothetical protein
MRIMPDEVTDRWILAKRLERIALGKLPSGE